MDQNENVTDLKVIAAADGKNMELYSIVLSTTVLILAILFGGGGCITVLIAMFIHRLLRKLRFILLGILLLSCCVFDFIWCPIEIIRLVLHHASVNRSVDNTSSVNQLKYVGSSLYVLLLCTIAAMIVLISLQNLIKIIRKYDTIPKMKLGIIFILIWLIISVSLTIAYVLVALGNEDDQSYHTINRLSFQFELGLQILWIVLLMIPVTLMVALHLRSKLWKTKLRKEASDHSTDNFTVPSLIIKSVEEMDDEDDDDADNEESSVALPSPDIVKDSTSGSPVSKGSKSALKKRSGSPSSQKVVFADTPSPDRDDRSPSPKFGEKFKSPNHLGVNMAAILGRRRHTIAQISDPHLDLMQRAKTYTYVRKFSVDISALQAQLENPKINTSFPFHSQQDIKESAKEGITKPPDPFGSQSKCNRRSRDDVIKSQEIAEETDIELEQEKEKDREYENKVERQDTQSINSQCQSVHSMQSHRSSMCPTPPLISLTQSDGQEKQIELNSDEKQYNTFPSSKTKSKLPKPCKLSCLLVATYILSIIPMLVTEIICDQCLSPKAYINIVTCMKAITTAQTMIYPQVIFCVDGHINKAVHKTLMAARARIFHLFTKQQPVPTQEDISDTEV